MRTLEWPTSLSGLWLVHWPSIWPLIGLTMAGVVASNVRNQRAKSLSIKDTREEAEVSRSARDLFVRLEAQSLYMSKGLIKFDCNQNLINVGSFSWDKSRSRQTMNGREGFVLFWDLVPCPLSHALVSPQLDRQTQNGSNSSVVLYLGLSVSSVGLIIFLVGVGEKGFKSLELQLIGPSLIGETYPSCQVIYAQSVQINMPIFLQYVFL